MLQYSIRHKAAPSIFLTALDSLRSRREQQQSPQQQQLLGRTVGPFVIPIPWTKERFNYFMSSVCKDFEAHCLVCPTHERVNTGQIPKNIWELVFINELYKGTQFDTAIDEPIVFTLRNRETNQLFNRCPKTVRKLTAEELTNVNAQNSSSSATS